MGASIAFLVTTTVLAGGVLAGVAAVGRRQPPTRAAARRRDPRVLERRDARSLRTKHRSRTSRPDS